MQNQSLSILEILDQMYAHSEDMLKLGEAKNATLIAFNGAIIVGAATLLNNMMPPEVKWYIIWVILMSGVSVFIGLASLIAKILHKPHKVPMPLSTNILFFGTLAKLSHGQVVDRIKERYGFQSVNVKLEEDKARQVVIVSQIAARKFNMFNSAIAFTFSGLLTPFSYVLYLICLDHDK